MCQGKAEDGDAPPGLYRYSKRRKRKAGTKTGLFPAALYCK